MASYPKLQKKTVKTITKEYYKIIEDNNNNSYKITNENNSYETPPGNPAQFDRTALASSIISYFNSYGNKVTSLINASTGTEENLDIAEEEVFRDIWVIGATLRPFYTAEFTEKFIQLMRFTAIQVVQMISFTRSGLDSRNLINQRTNNILLSDIGFLLSSYNNFWDASAVRTIWSNVVNSWFNAIKAKASKDTAEFDKNMTKAEESLRAFSSLILNGIVQQKPELFFDVVA